MNGGPSIAIVPAGEAARETLADETVSETMWHGHAPDESEPAPIWPRIAAAGLVLGSLAWMIGLLWSAGTRLGTADPVTLAQFGATLLSVPTLVAVLWLLWMRSSTAEARRFHDVSAGLRREAESLERTVGMLAHAIDTNRERLADQVTALLAMGDAATERLGALGSDIAHGVSEADAHARSLAAASDVAQANLGVLLASLPRAHAQVEEVGRLLDRTGLSASEQAAALDAQIVALAERGREADVIAGGAAQRLAAHITRMEATSETAGARLETVTAEMSAAVDALLGRTADAVENARSGIAAQGDAMLAMVGAHQATLDQAARASADALASRIASIETVIDKVAGRLDGQRASSETLVTGLEDSIQRVETRLDALHAQGIERSQLLAASISALGGSADAMTEALRTGDSMATRAIGTAESLLIALDAAAREIDETLPDALGRLDTRIAASKSVIASTKPELLSLVTAAESTHDAIEAIAGVIADQRRTLDTVSGTLLQALDAGRGKAEALGGDVDEAIARAHRFADDAAPRLVEALVRVRDSAVTAAERARQTLVDVIPDAAATLEEAGAAAMRRAVDGSVERQVTALVSATDAAVAGATRAAERLAAQVRDLEATGAALDAQLAAARAEREEAERENFARQAALLIDALHSAAIDITKAFAPDVSDSAWAAYLKGDRGVFTRRAVRVLDGGDAREIGRLYDTDRTFHDAVNRYIHDFEAMLRSILAQREGTPLGVTLLSSDMGKLYVALAQGIERLR